MTASGGASKRISHSSRRRPIGVNVGQAASATAMTFALLLAAFVASSPAGNAAPLSIPLVGTVDASRFSLPVLTVLIALLDSFNPCAFFVLFSILSLLVHSHSRRRMAIIGGIFVLFSGLLYFLFMAAWLNIFLLFGRLKTITVIAGIVATVVASLNIKDFFFFGRGTSLVIPERAKPKLFERMRGIMHAGSLPAMVAATVVLAFVANSYELICTSGFPMVYTRALTLERLPLAGYYLYLALYNVIYIIPLASIVLFFMVTLGSRKLTEWQGRVLKLLSGAMMLALGIVLLAHPTLLTNALASAGLFFLAIVVTCAVVAAARRLGLDGTPPSEG